MSDRPKVKPISGMDNETFLQHMNGRHKGFAGITKFGRSNVPDDEDEHLLRTMHEMIHTRDLYESQRNHDHTHYEER